jgi:hypothetical protein
MQNESYLSGGFEDRFVIERTDGKPIPPGARYIVLDYSGRDPHAIKALQVYADSVQSDNPQFAEDIRRALKQPEAFPAQHRYAE